MSITALADARYLSVTTTRRDGRQVSTPVWFLVDGEDLWARSASAAGKITRIRHTPEVLLAPCRRDGTEIGPRVPALATITRATARRDVHRALVRRYGVFAVLYEIWWTRARRTDVVLLRFTLGSARPESPSRRPGGATLNSETEAG